jgi:hypothetical protein
MVSGRYSRYSRFALEEGQIHSQKQSEQATAERRERRSPGGSQVATEGASPIYPTCTERCLTWNAVPSMRDSVKGHLLGKEENPLVLLRESVTETQGLVLILLASNIPSYRLGQGILTQATWAAPDLARRSSLVFGRVPRTCRHRRGHGYLEYPPGRPCHQCRYVTDYRCDSAGLYDLPRQCAG